MLGRLFQLRFIFFFGWRMVRAVPVIKSKEITVDDLIRELELLLCLLFIRLTNGLIFSWLTRFFIVANSICENTVLRNKAAITKHGKVILIF